MKRKIRTPEEIGAEESTEKGTFALYLDADLMKEIKQRAGRAKVSASKLVNEAIKLYLSELKTKK
jgi:metal-responsive CopG/Arc/MetJ family transcriptional regulator